MERRESFNTAAQLYDEARPSYPDVAINWILDRTNIASDDTLLEIGPGTGQATLKFAERGYQDPTVSKWVRAWPICWSRSVGAIMLR